ncbi:unnamed protein product [Cyprideis torosa]|uniref:Uncharacterized protein n=1 Tax=Cyprideis torosa TaxID=163714 RepID=A0A7R8ZID4_9CRUS|nr:unnamed protein product [Cyprideis torosa]CAG0884555.1 unnamed protein product [Cyprideis torosa]
MRERSSVSSVPKSDMASSGPTLPASLCKLLQSVSRRDTPAGRCPLEEAIERGDARFVSVTSCRRSQVWEHFEVLQLRLKDEFVDSEYVRCTSCHNCLLHRGRFSGTSHLYGHLKGCRKSSISADSEEGEQNERVPKKVKVEELLANGRCFWDESEELDSLKRHFEVLRSLTGETVGRYLRCRHCEKMMAYSSDRILSSHLELCPGFCHWSLTEALKQEEAHRNFVNSDVLESLEDTTDSFDMEETIVTQPLKSGHFLNMSTEFASYFLTSLFTDVSLISAEGMSFRAHAAYLAQLSSAALQERPLESEEVCISLPDFQFGIIERVLNLCYLGSTSAGESELSAMADLAEALGMDSVSTVLERAVKVARNRTTSRRFQQKQKDAEEMGFAEVPSEEQGLWKVEATPAKPVVMRDNRPFLCNHCGSRFKNRSHVKAHIRKVHSEKKFQCQFCDFATRNIHHLREHQATLHKYFEEGSEFPCDHCDLSFARRRTRELHLRIIHGITDKRAPCPYCGKMYPTWRGQLRVHLMTHGPENQYKCDTCGKSFKRMTNLRYHALKHGPRNKICAKCGEAFFRWDYLERHSKRCEGVPPKASAESKGPKVEQLEEVEVKVF